MATNSEQGRTVELVKGLHKSIEPCESWESWERIEWVDANIIRLLLDHYEDLGYEHGAECPCVCHVPTGPCTCDCPDRTTEVPDATPNDE